MTEEQIRELDRIQSEIKIYDDAISVFDINKRLISGIFDIKEVLGKIEKMRFGYFLECFKKNEKNHVRLNAKGFFGGKSIEVDQEFVDMCLDYFKNKRAELEEELKNL